MRALELKIPPIIVVFIFGFGMWLAARKTPGLSISVPAPRPISIVIALIGITLGFVSAISFRKARTTLNPTRPDASTSLVTSGIFGISRNPIYLGMLMLLLAWAIYLANPLPFLFLPGFVVYMNLFQIYPEERFLSSHFGAEFHAYQSRVRRWL